MNKSRHNLSHEKLLTCDIGQLVPCGLVEVLPGDRFKSNSNVMVRLSPLAAPVMHGMSIRIHHFFVPHRLTWDPTGNTKFEDFITGGPDGMDSTTVPMVPTTGVESDLMDYLGLPLEPNVDVSALPVRGCNLIYNEWYRDQDLITERDLDDTTIPNVAYEKDYFSTARPWPQKGEEVTLPLGTRAPVLGFGTSGSITGQATDQKQTGGLISDFVGATASVNMNVEEDPDLPGFPGVWADLSSATAATINSLRRASGLQRFAEARARFGSRYAEYVRHAFGAAPLDARLQRPEFLGGGTQRVSISEVLQTAPEATPRYGVGDMYGHGIGLTKSNRYNVKFNEHGYVISMFSVRPRASYSNGVERTWLRMDREDFYQKELAHIGQQEVKQQEVYATSSNKDTVFGWSDRYAEYRTVRSSACGEFRSTLDYWHLARQFATEPALNQTFVEVTPADTKRIFNEQTNHSLWCFVSHRIQARRVVPRNATARIL